MYFYRTITLGYVKDTRTDDFDTFEFRMEQKNFQNSTLNPDNAGFCTNDCL